MPTCIAVRCPHCQKDQVAKRGKTARRTQRYICQNALCRPKPNIDSAGELPIPLQHEL